MSGHWIEGAKAVGRIQPARIQWKPDVRVSNSRIIPPPQSKR